MCVYIGRGRNYMLWFELKHDTNRSCGKNAQAAVKYGSFTVLYARTIHSVLFAGELICKRIARKWSK